VTLKSIYGLLFDIKADKDLRKAVVSTETEPLMEKIDVLIAEDNVVNMLLARTIIKRIAPNATIYEAKNGLEAVQICKNRQVDVILMDIQMPEMNGYEATKKIRAMKSSSVTPIFALTAGNVKGEREKCLAAGMNDFITKPVVANTVLLSLKRWLRFDDEGLGLDGPARLSSAEDIDLKVLKEYIGGDMSVLGEVLSVLAIDYKGFLDQLDELAGNKDLKGIHHLFFKIYDTSITLGLTRLIELIAEVQECESFEKLPVEIISDIREQLNAVIAFLTKYEAEQNLHHQLRI
jgi:CheY-like chemotaxis protein